MKQFAQIVHSVSFIFLKSIPLPCFGTVDLRSRRVSSIAKPSYFSVLETGMMLASGQFLLSLVRQ